MSNEAKHRLGVEICTSELRAVIVDHAENLAMTRTTELDLEGETVTQVAEMIGSIRGDYKDLDRVGIAIAGLVDRATGKVAFSAHRPEHSKLDLAGQIKTASGLGAVIENDANAAAYGEYRLGAGRGSENFFYATLGEGVGGAIILGGELWHGASGFAGEFGYVPINSEGMRLEEVASAENIIRRTRERFHTDSTSSLNKLAEEDINLEQIVRAAREDDDFAQMMLERTGVYVGSAIASVINVLNPEKIVVGGSIMEAKTLVLDAIIERARELSFEPSFNSTTIVEGELGPYAAAAGAALL